MWFRSFIVFATGINQKFVVRKGTWRDKSAFSNKPETNLSKFHSRVNCILYSTHSNTLTICLRRDQSVDACYPFFVQKSIKSTFQYFS